MFKKAIGDGSRHSENALAIARVTMLSSSSWM